MFLNDKCQTRLRVFLSDEIAKLKLLIKTFNMYNMYYCKTCIRISKYHFWVIPDVRFDFGKLEIRLPSRHNDNSQMCYLLKKFQFLQFKFNLANIFWHTNSLFFNSNLPQFNERNFILTATTVWQQKVYFRKPLIFRTNCILQKN